LTFNRSRKRSRIKGTFIETLPGLPPRRCGALQEIFVEIPGLSRWKKRIPTTASPRERKGRVRFILLNVEILG
jgi:hypothetical protein